MTILCKLDKNSWVCSICYEELHFLYLVFFNLLYTITDIFKAFVFTSNEPRFAITTAKKYEKCIGARPLTRTFLINWRVRGLRGIRIHPTLRFFPSTTIIFSNLKLLTFPIFCCGYPYETFFSSNAYNLSEDFCGTQYNNYLYFLLLSKKALYNPSWKGSMEFISEGIFGGINKNVDILGPF